MVVAGDPEGIGTFFLGNEITSYALTVVVAPLLRCLEFFEFADVVRLRGEFGLFSEVGDLIPLNISIALYISFAKFESFEYSSCFFLFMDNRSCRSCRTSLNRSHFGLGGTSTTGTDY